MGFNDAVEKVKDESLPPAQRYISLRRCVEIYAPFGFSRTWKYLRTKFGLNESVENESLVFIRSAEFLEKDREAWLKVMEAQDAYVRSRVDSGLPIPTFRCEHG